MEIKTPPVIIEPGASFENVGDDTAVVFTEKHTWNDVLRWVIADLGEEARYHVDALLNEPTRSHQSAA